MQFKIKKRLILFLIVIFNLLTLQALAVEVNKESDSKFVVPYETTFGCKFSLKLNNGNIMVVDNSSYGIVDKYGNIVKDVTQIATLTYLTTANLTTQNNVVIAGYDSSWNKPFARVYREDGSYKSSVLFPDMIYSINKSISLSNGNTMLFGYTAYTSEAGYQDKCPTITIINDNGTIIKPPTRLSNFDYEYTNILHLSNNRIILFASYYKEGMLINEDGTINKNISWGTGNLTNYLAINTPDNKILLKGVDFSTNIKYKVILNEDGSVYEPLSAIAENTTGESISTVVLDSGKLAVFRYSKNTGLALDIYNTNGTLYTTQSLQNIYNRAVLCPINFGGDRIAAFYTDSPTGVAILSITDTSNEGIATKLENITDITTAINYLGTVPSTSVKPALNSLAKTELIKAGNIYLQIYGYDNTQYIASTKTPSAEWILLSPNSYISLIDNVLQSSKIVYYTLPSSVTDLVIK